MLVDYFTGAILLLIALGLLVWWYYATLAPPQSYYIRDYSMDRYARKNISCTGPGPRTYWGEDCFSTEVEDVPPVPAGEAMRPGQV